LDRSRITKKNLGSEITTEEHLIKLSNNNILKQYNLTSGFYSGITKVFPGSGYIDFHEGNIIVMSSRGILVFKKELEDIKTNFQQIKNNVNEFIGIKHFNKNRSFSIKDMYIFNNKIILSYTEEIKEDCWNTSLLISDFNYENIEFEKLFSVKECIFQVKQVKTDPEEYSYTSEFNPRQSGGKIIALDDNNILLSIGEYRKRDLAQDTKSINGKIIKVNINNSNYEIISMGHRNPQGLYYDKEGKFILETEHGPLGGDEINLIEFNNIKKDKIQNFGWPISSAGEHYGGKSLKNKKNTKDIHYINHIVNTDLLNP